MNQQKLIVTYFDSSGVEHIPKEIRKFIRNKNIVTNIYRIQPYNSIMCGYFCIGFIGFILKDKSLFICDLNGGCMVYMFSLRFSGSKFLINLQRQFCVRKIFSCT